MSLDFLKNRAKKSKEEFLSYVQDKTFERIEKGTPITLEEYKGMRMNSYDRRMLQPLFDDETLIHVTKYALDIEGNTKFRDMQIPAHYTESVLRVHVWELLERFEKMISEKRNKG
jgi:hypothetical protein